MKERPEAGRKRRLATRIAMLGLAAVAVLVVCSPAVALRPRTTPANAARLTATQAVGVRDARAAAAHDLALARILARHTAAASSAAGGAPSVAVHQIRTHHAVVLGAQGALAVATLAALAAIILVVAAVIAGERREVARRRRAEAAARPAATPGHQVVN